MELVAINKFLNVKNPILITGESGTGKSYLAKKIFSESKINKAKFLTMHLASLNEDLFESELFGHVKGAFSGAIENRTGYLSDVHEGTLFMDEVGELSLDAQKKLLYLLEEKKFTPVGSTCSYDFKGRIILATNKNLEELVFQKKFREDLYYRIKTFQINIPNLENNSEILNELIDSLWKKLKIEHSQPFAFLDNEAREYLLKREWKGNLRELKHHLEYALLLSEKNTITVADFPSEHKKTSIEKSTQRSLEDWVSLLSDNYNESLAFFEKTYLKSRFEKYDGKINHTARVLGISKTTLISKARKYRINTLKIRADSSDLAA